MTLVLLVPRTFEENTGRYLPIGDEYLFRCGLHCLRGRFHIVRAAHVPPHVRAGSYRKVRIIWIVAVSHLGRMNAVIGTVVMSYCMETEQKGKTLLFFLGSQCEHSRCIFNHNFRFRPPKPSSSPVKYKYIISQVVLLMVWKIVLYYNENIAKAKTYDIHLWLNIYGGRRKILAQIDKNKAENRDDNWLKTGKSRKQFVDPVLRGP